MQFEKIIITNIVDQRRSAFAVRAANGEQVYIPAATVKHVNLRPNEVVWAALIENNSFDGTMKNRTPWMSPLITRENISEVDTDKVVDAFDAFDYPVTAEEAGVSDFEAHCAFHDQALAKVILIEGPYADPVIMWTNESEKV